MNMAKRRVGKIVGCILLAAVILSLSGYYFLKQKNEAEASALSSKARNVGYPKMLFPPIDQSVVGWWKLNDAAGQTVVKDWSASGNTGTSANNIVSATGYTGVASTAMSFNGTTDYVSIPSSLPLSYTMAFNVWFKKADTGTVGQIIRFGFYGYSLLVDSDNLLKFRSISESYGQVASASSVADGNWHHALAMRVGVYGPGTLYLYVDGVLMPTTDYGVYIDTDPNSNRIGREKAGGTYYFNGSISDVRIYNRALSANEVKGLYMRGRP